VLIDLCVGYSDGTGYADHADGTQTGPLKKGYWYNIVGHGAAPEHRIFPHNPPAQFNTVDEIIKATPKTKPLEIA